MSLFVRSTQKPRHLGLRERFALAMGVVVIASGLAVTLLVEWRLTSSLQTTVRQNLQHVAGMIAQEIAADVGRHRLEMARLALALGSLKDPRSSQVQPLLDRLKSSQPAYAWIGLADSQGKVLAASDGLLVGADVSARPWFSGARKKEHFGDPHQAQMLARHLPPGQDGEPPRFFDIAAPVRDADDLWEGVIGAHLYTDWVGQVVEKAVQSRALPGTPDIFVADARGEWLFTADGMAVDQPAALPQPDPEERFIVAEQRVRFHDLSDTQAWKVVVRESADEAFAELHEHRQQMMIIVPATALALALAAWFIAGRVVGPVARLADTARRHVATTGHVLDDAVVRGKDEARLLDLTLHRLALNDPLTGTLNRNALKQHLSALQQARTAEPGTGPVFAVLWINVDDFHAFNRAHGADIGDQLLRGVALRLRQLGGVEAQVARLAGDDFALVTGPLPAVHEEAVQAAQALAGRVVGAFRTPLQAESGEFRITASVGLAVVDDRSASPEEVLSQAELALREAKLQGKRQTVIYEPGLQARLVDQAAFEKDLRAAVPTDLTVLYQPQVRADGTVVGAELLVRWTRTGHGPVSPARFIPVAERTGLIVDIGRWVLDQALRQLRHWKDDPRHRHLVLAVNVSAREFNDPEFVAGVRERLLASGADPSRLKLELTESALAVDIEEVVSRMRALKALGVSFALDDFGTGFSSLGYLRRMPIDQLKIDQTFVADLLLDESADSIVRAILALGEGLGLEVVAEGVETAGQRQRLADLGCRVYQGYLFGQPGTADALEGWDRR